MANKPRSLQAALSEGRRQAESQYLASTAREVGRILGGEVTAAATRFVELAAPAALAAAGGGADAAHPRFVMPHADEVYDQLHAQARLGGYLHGVSVNVARVQLAGVLAILGISLDVRNEVMEGVLAQRGQLITAITENHRALVMRLLDDAWREGVGVREAARLLRSRGQIQTLARARMIARTEIVSTANGASVAMMRHTGSFRYKQWLTSPGARHPRHEYDASLIGQTVKVSAPFDVHGWPMDYPGDPAGPAEDVINCRCTVIYTDTPSG